jgi:hypothetical protein
VSGSEEREHKEERGSKVSRYRCCWSARGVKCRVGCSSIGALWRAERLCRELVGWVR